jgi:hypothetical protein
MNFPVVHSMQTTTFKLTKNSYLMGLAVRFIEIILGFNFQSKPLRGKQKQDTRELKHN